MSKIEDVLAGCLGIFYPQDGEIAKLGEGQRGYISLGEEGSLKIDTLEESDGFSYLNKEDSRLPRFIVGQTEHGGIVATNITGRSSSLQLMGNNTSTHHFRSRSLISGVDLGRTNSLKFYKVSLFFPNANRWAAMKGVEDSFETDGEGRHKSVTIRLEAAPEVSAKITKTRKISLSTYWSYHGEEGKKELYVPLEISCSSTRRQDLSVFMETIFYVQDLLNIAHQDYVAADGGKVYPNDSGLDGAEVWDSRFMTRPAAVPKGKSANRRPLFFLPTIGGASALVRWISLCKTHPRAVTPITRTWRSGRISPAVRLMDLASGLEYWIAAHKRSTAWAQLKPPPLAVAKTLGKSFAEWTGDQEKWADAVWSEYNSIKHDAGYKVDPFRAYILGESAAVLLMCTLLKRVTGSNAIVELIVHSHEFNQLGEEVRNIVANHVHTRSGKGTRRTRHKKLRMPDAGGGHSLPPT